MNKIFVMGGGGFAMEPENLLLDKYLLSLANNECPKICFIGTASGDSQNYIDRFYNSYRLLNCRPSHLSLFKPHTRNIESFILDQDIIHVGGGNTLNLLCLWREWKLDKILAKALSKDVILSGMSAGMICWFNQGLTDSKGIGLEPLDCLGFLDGSACPHFDGEEDRSPIFLSLVESGELSDGLALDDGVGALYVDGNIREVVSSRASSRGYLVKNIKGKSSAEELQPRYLGNQNSEKIEFKKIDLDLHKDTAINFRADSFMTSFGTDKGFWEDDGQGGERYIEWLNNKDPNKFGAYHIWKNDEIIGQIELALFKDDESWGYINLYYLRENYRGKGLSKKLDEFATEFFKGLGVEKAKLSVSPTNSRAIKFYEKNGWIDKGPRSFEGRKGHAVTNLVHFMEKNF